MLTFYYIGIGAIIQDVDKCDINHLRFIIIRKSLKIALNFNFALNYGLLSALYKSVMCFMRFGVQKLYISPKRIILLDII